MKKLSHEQVFNCFKKEGYVLTEQYQNSSTKVKALCPAGHSFLVRVGNFIHRKSRCPVCDASRQAKVQKYPYESLLDLFGERLITTKEQYEANHKKSLKVSVMCKCGNIKTNTSNALRKYPNCMKCKDPRVSLSAEEVKARILSKGFTLLSDYSHSKQKLKVKCDKHGVFESRFNDIDQGHGCPACSGLESSMEREVGEYVISLGFKIEKRNRNILGGMEIDIYVPEKKIGIEMNGLYWHSEHKKSKPDSANLKKLKTFRAKGLKLLAFYEDEWKNKQEIVKSIIATKLGVVKTKVYARKTKVVKVDQKKAKAFFEMSHLDGHVPAKSYIGLELDGELIMCISVRTSFSGEQELARLSCKPFHIVVGGASKLLKQVKGKMISYSNNRLGSGELYKSLGFADQTKTERPSYWYTDFRKRVWRFKCRHLQDKPGTEREQALAGLFEKHFGHSNPVYRIYDYGHLRWVRE